MNKISQLISLLGGTGVVAEKLNIQPSAISNWKRLNKIPNKKHEAILKLSSNLDINIEKFFPKKNINGAIASAAISRKICLALSYLIIEEHL